MMTNGEFFKRLGRNEMSSSDTIKTTLEVGLRNWPPFEQVEFLNGQGQAHVSKLPEATLEAMLKQFRIDQFKIAGHDAPAQALVSPKEAQARQIETGVITENTKIIRSNGGHEIFRCEAANWGTAIQNAVNAHVSLEGANLCRKHIESVNFSNLHMDHAQFEGSTLRNCQFRHTSLVCASFYLARVQDCDFAGADLTAQTTLSGAHMLDCGFTGTMMCAKQLVGRRPIFSMGPLGDQNRWLTLHLTEAGPMLCTGCFYGNIRSFEKKVKAEKARGTANYVAYMAAIDMMKAYAKAWTPRK